MRAVIATHGHCFDGLASAVLFTRLLREVEGRRPLEIEYRTCGYGPTQRPDMDRLFTGEQNALLDYRFLPHERLTWYFDHHRTAFATEGDRTRFEQGDAGRYHFDAAYGSCTKLVADVAREHFGVSDPALEPLVRWADVVDSAAFASPEQAISRTDPIMQLVSVIEHHGEDRFLARYAPMLLERPLEEVARSGDVRRRFKPLGDRHDHFVDRVRAQGRTMGRVVFVDLTDAVLDSIGKFVTYALYPQSVYSVVVALLKNGAKVSVGYNPWSGQALDTDISAICARHGGGGHPVVGAVQFPRDQVGQAREIAHQIALELAG
jgi:hypothetical protein